MTATTTTAGARLRVRCSQPAVLLGAAIAVVALVSVLISAPGRYVGDNRFELYWSPFDLLRRHLAIWDATRGLGRPRWDFWPVPAAAMAALRGLGLGPALAERIWHATLLTTAGTGIVAALRLFRPRIRIEHWVAAALYAFGPFAAVYLLPTNLFVGHAFAPWFLVAFVLGVRGTRPWRWAALFALLVFVPGNMNYPALLFAALPIVPAALYLVLVERSVSWRRVLSWVASAAALSLIVSAAALVTTGASAAINDENLALTETVREISRPSSWPESWRGLGLWLAYWGDSRGAIVPQFARFFWAPVVVLTFAAPLAALAVLWRSRWRPRLLFGAVMLLGLVLMVGAYPLDDTSPYGRLLLWGFDHFPGFLAIRSGHKAGVMVALGVAVLAAVGAAGALRAAVRFTGGAPRVRIVRAGAVVAVLAVVAAGSFPFWTGRLYSPDEGAREIPAYWQEAADWLDVQPGDGRVLVLPSSAYGAYTWGNTGDDILEGLITRPTIARGLLSLWSGTAEGANLVAALDDYVGSGTYEPGVLGPIAARLGVRYVLIRNDLDWATTRRPRPASLDTLRADPDLTAVRAFGAPGENVLSSADATDEAVLPPIEVYSVDDFTGLARAEAAPPLLVSGDGDAWPGLARGGILAQGGPVRYTGAATTTELEQLLARGSPVVVTDTDRRRVRNIPLFDTVARSSYTLAAGEDLDRPAQDLFAVPGSRTVVRYADATRIHASSYGRPALPQAYLRPSNAFDGDPTTRWEIAPEFVEPIGQWVRVDLERPQRLASIEITTTSTAPTDAAPDPDHITHLEVVLSDGTTVALPVEGGRARATLPDRATSSVEVRITRLAGADPTPVGLSSVTIDDLDLREIVQLPDDLARRADRHPELAALLEAAPFTFQFARLDPVDDETVEPTLRRRFRVLSERDFTLRATGSFDASTISDQCRDVGITIDGQPIPVRLDARSATEDLTAIGCGSTRSIRLTAGTHTLSVTGDAPVRRLWLSSRGSSTGRAPGSPIQVGTVRRGRADFEVKVTTPAPAYLISGASSDPGWSATLDGGDAGAQVSLDGQAAWRVPTGSHVLVGERTDQGRYTLSLLVSTLGVLGCVVLLVRGRIR